MVAVLRFVFLLSLFVISVESAPVSELKSVLLKEDHCAPVEKECLAKCEHYCHETGMEPQCEYMGEKVGCICVCHHGH
ncbi:unnamed protein product [Bursaphelenchus xylophilus]|uniref:(pine wood nematode) hypothetical protein n=1 Tax=Bursaphelenchus xylophilus TaxID=6326 RepID=A0A1I7RK45_BURXY|nr:unnamed protein product [Bursaphelenchus xylophilus]CAG9131517.1 unnamed protein product [Bursaphelenchus xylophilus]